MNSRIKKIAALIMAIVLASCTVSAFAENAIQTILNAKTTQAFAQDPVSDEDLNTILAAGLSATSAINQQPWYFVALTTQEVMDEIAGAGFGGAQGGYDPSGFGGQQGGNDNGYYNADFEDKT